MPTQVNPVLSQAEQVFKTVVWDVLFQAGNTWLLANVPFLNVPVISQIEGFTETEVRDHLFSIVKELIDVVYIKLKDPIMQAAYTNASVKLQVIEAESGVNSDVYKQALIAEALSFSQHVRYNQ